MIQLEDRRGYADTLAPTGTGDEANHGPDYDIGLRQSLEIFDFSAPLPTKREGVFRVFYNNCNGMEINNTIVCLKKKRINKSTIIYKMLRHQPKWTVL